MLWLYSIKSLNPAPKGKCTTRWVGIRVSHGHTAPGNRTGVCRYTNEYAIVGGGTSRTGTSLVPVGWCHVQGCLSGAGRMRASALTEPRRGWLKIVGVCCCNAWVSHTVWLVSLPSLLAAKLQLARCCFKDCCLGQVCFQPMERRLRVCPDS